MSRYLAFRAQLSNELRTESLFGVDHLVVPVVALVEGVIQGMASPTPELALAEEFGKVPEGWNGRPLVMNHPVLNNQPVSANAPTVLETFAFGQLFNTTVEDGKLKTEAWINLDRVNALGGEVASTVERIQKGTTVEVSTGLFTGVEQVQGKFNNKSYDAIWRNIVPDHLAFLSEGVKGACSIEDGCGTPRVNSETHWQEYKMSTTDGDCGCGCNGTGTCKDSHVHTNATEPTTEPTEPSFDIGRLLSNAAPAGMFSKDIRALLAMAIEKTYGYAYVIGFTADHVIFELYDANEGRYLYARQSYTITDNKVVSLGDDKENVLLLTEIVPESGTQAGQPKLFQAKGNSEMAGENEQIGRASCRERVSSPV